MSRKKDKTVQKDPAYCIKKSVLEQKMQESYQKGLEDAKRMMTEDIVTDVFTMLLGLPMMVLHMDYGWGHRKRLPEFADKVIKEFNTLNLETSSLEDIRQWIYEQSGVKFENIK
jgi:hypothetical protein